MSFDYKTINRKNEFQKKKIFIGYNLETEQVYIFIIFGLIGFWIALLPTVSLIWKILVLTLLVVMAKSFSSMKNGRTYWKLFRMFVRKKTT